MSGLRAYSPKIVVEPPGPKVKALMEKHGSRLPRYTQPIMGGQRIFIKNPDGNIFIDFISGHCVTDIGCSHPKLVEALQTQAAKGTRARSYIRESGIFFWRMRT